VRQVARAILLCGTLLVPVPGQAQERSVGQSAEASPAELRPAREAHHQETQLRLFRALEGVVIGDRTADAPRMTTRLKRCPSKTKRVLIGAAVGAAGGGLFAWYVDNRVLGSARPGVVLSFAAGGAGVGALVGLVACR